MSTADLTRLADRPADGGAPARRAVIRWAWRLLRRQWRQQVLILALVSVAVAATIVGSAVATNTPPPKTAGFGSAEDSISFAVNNAHTAQVIARLQHRFGEVEVIENATEAVPGSIETYQLRAEDPHGPFSGPMLSLVAGRFPKHADEVAVTKGVASAFHLVLGTSWRVGGVSRRVVGIVENPQSLLDEFALLLPGQLHHVTSVTALFDAGGVPLASTGHDVRTPASVVQSNPLNPETISLAALVLGMVLIALVSVGGFTVLAQRRLRAIGMLESTGATDRHVRLVVRANGAAVGVAGAIVGFLLGLAIWLVYRPALEQSAHHVIAVFALPWSVVGAAMVLAVLATSFAASRPARAITKVPIVAALSGRPAPPRQVHRSAIPGIACLAGAFALLAYSGGTNGGNGSGGAPEFVFGIILLIPGLILLAPFFLSLAARLARRAPIAARLALRDLARYRARSGSALAAIAVGVLVAVIVMLAAAARYGNVFDWAGPNLAANELVIHALVPQPGARILGPPVGGQSKPATQRAASRGETEKTATSIARSLGAELIPLEQPSAGLGGSHLGRPWDGPLYVATPALLRAFGISRSSIPRDAEILSSRPGLSSISGLILEYRSDQRSAQGAGAGGTLTHPVVQEIPALPTGTSAPNTVITEHAMREFHLSHSTSDWLVEGRSPFSAAQISSAELAASTSGLSIEPKNDQPSSFAVIGWATAFGIAIALGVLGMSVGLLRSETAGALPILAAMGASRATRRALSATTAGGLGLLGALLGTIGGYVAMVGWLESNALNGGVAALANVPIAELLFIVLAMPAFAAILGWVFAGREPAALAHRGVG